MVEEPSAMNKCPYCGGTMHKVSEKNDEAKWVCFQDESHIRIVKKLKAHRSRGRVRN